MPAAWRLALYPASWWTVGEVTNDSEAGWQGSYAIDQASGAPSGSGRGVKLLGCFVSEVPDPEEMAV